MLKRIAPFKKISFLLYLVLTGSASAQSALPLNNYSVHDGLPSSEVYDVMQDSKGFMWFSTDHGVCRYDGYQFKTWTTADGLSDNTIFATKEDYKGRIWFLSYSGRLSYYFHDSIFSLPDNEVLKQMIGTSIITSLVVDSSDNLYLASRALQGFIQIKIGKKNSLKLVHLPEDIVYVINIPGIKTPLFGSTNKQGNLLADSSLRVNYYTYSKNENIVTENYETVLKGKSKDMRIQAINSYNDLLVSFGSELFLINEEKVITTYHLNSFIIRLENDVNGQTWIMLRGQAPLLFNHRRIEKPQVMQLFRDQQITSAKKDNEGGLWLTSLIKGIYYISNPEFKILTKENGLQENKINCITISADSSVWVSSGLGNKITIINKDTFFNRPFEDLSSFSAVNTILFDKNVWFCSGAETSVYKLNDYSYPACKKFNAGGKNMVPNSDGSVWVNSIGSMNKFKVIGNELRMIKRVFVNTVIKKIVRENDSALWIGTITGLYKYENDKLIFWGDKYPALAKRIDDISLTTHNDLWLATRDTGLVMLSKNKLQYFNVKNGLVSNFAQCMNFDDKGNLWVGTNGGLSHLLLHYDNEENCVVDSIKNIVSSNLKEINCIACLRNIIYVGTNNGLISFNMSQENINKTPPPIYITTVKIDDKSFPADSNKFNLNYNENNVSINYVGLTYRDASKPYYRYKMEGIDTGWTYTQYTNVQYSKLVPGNYSFIVAARNNDGIWSKEFAKFSFTIKPPFWGTWWAKTIMTCGLIFLIYWRIRIIKENERAKAEANRKMIEMQLRELRSRLDPHFLFNNFSTLSHLVESNSPNASLFADELSKYFRYSLQSSEKEFTALMNELDHAEGYVRLLKIRYGDNLIVTWNVDISMKEYYISNHSLQLLIENTIKHNELSEENPLRVEIRTTNKNTLIVSNNVQTKTGIGVSTGIGLKSIDERYYLLYKRKIIISQTKDYFEVELPLLNPQEYESINN